MTDQVIQNIKNLFEEINAYQKPLPAVAGYSCLEGCGACCKSPNVEATAAEMLPLAEEILKQSDWASTFNALKTAEKQCVFYRPTSADKESGRCSVYQYRPTICRLFGASVQRRKDGKLEYSACIKQKEKFGKEIESANQNINSQGSDVSTMQDFGQKLSMMFVGQSNLSETLPINEAAIRAIEHLAFQRSFIEDPS